MKNSTNEKLTITAKRSGDESKYWQYVFGLNGYQYGVEIEKSNEKHAILALKNTYAIIVNLGDAALTNGDVDYNKVLQFKDYDQDAAIAKVNFEILYL